ncbi:synaptonemal complex central element protein 1-like isoform X2 [Odocoileus virginianus]|uniref:Synaptonemal complex central element protein 1-like isoform X2 n=1 Tax=Odocoileus virginianus TaxID=9874 RepID=A0ABM4GWB9_ODOVR
MAGKLEPREVKSQEVVEDGEGQTESSEKTKDLLEMVKKLQKEGSLEPQIEDLINRIHELQQAKEKSSEELGEVQALWEALRQDLDSCAVWAEDEAPETQSVPVFSSEWRESAPGGGSEQKARGPEDPPAALPKEGGGGTEELRVGRTHRANFYPELSGHRESRTEQAGVAHGRTAGGLDRPAQGPLGIPHAEAATGLGDPCPAEQPGAAAHRREAGAGPAGGRGAAAAPAARGPRRPGGDRRVRGPGRRGGAEARPQRRLPGGRGSPHPGLPAGSRGSSAPLPRRLKAEPEKLGGEAPAQTQSTPEDRAGAEEVGPQLPSEGDLAPPTELVPTPHPAPPSFKLARE